MLKFGGGHQPSPGLPASPAGALAFAVRGALNLDALSGYMEAAVGLSIIIIGINGVRESREWATEHEEEEQAWAVPSREPSDSWSSSLKVSCDGASGAGAGDGSTLPPPIAPSPRRRSGCRRHPIFSPYGPRLARVSCTAALAPAISSV